jgi:hypothetical protein
MRKLVLFTPVLLLSCGAHERVRVGLDQVPPGSKCTQSAALDSFVGQSASAELGARMMAAARAPALRWVAAGAPTPTDFNSRRLTVQLDSLSRVASIKCG